MSSPIWDKPFDNCIQNKDVLGGPTNELVGATYGGSVLEVTCGDPRDSHRLRRGSPPIATAWSYGIIVPAEHPSLRLTALVVL